MQLTDIPTRILGLFVPLVFIFLSSSFLIISLFRIFVSFNFNVLLSRQRFQDFWFANFWQWFGSLTNDLDKSVAAPLVARAYGRVLDLGYFLAPFPSLLLPPFRN
jgi:hypothetical protein